VDHFGEPFADGGTKSPSRSCEEVGQRAELYQEPSRRFTWVADTNCRKIVAKQFGGGLAFGGRLLAD
jgi:hypothetical protein